MGYGDLLYLNNPGQGHQDPYATPAGLDVSKLKGVGRESTDTDIYGNQKVPGQSYLTGVYQPAPPPPPYVTSTYTKRELGGWVRTYQTWSDGRTVVLDEYQDKSAGEAVAEMFTSAGLDQSFVNQLMATIDNIYNTNIMPTSAQIKNAVYNSEAYKQRFKANEIIRQRIADGQGRPGDRMLLPAEYIALENTYRTILQDAEMPEGYYDSPDDFTSLISNSISASEFKSRVDTAYDALNRADQSVVNSLQRYYNLTTGDLVAYLLDPAKAMPLLEGRASARTANPYGLNSRTDLERAYQSAQVGGSAERQGLEVDRTMSEEIVDLGRADQADEAFSMAGSADPDLRRLGSLYGQPLDFKDLVRESLNLSGGVEAGRKRRKFASKERAAFGAQGALDKNSLTRMQDV